RYVALGVAQRARLVSAVGVAINRFVGVAVTFGVDLLGLAASGDVLAAAEDLHFSERENAGLRQVDTYELAQRRAAALGSFGRFGQQRHDLVIRQRARL